MLNRIKVYILTRAAFVPYMIVKCILSLTAIVNFSNRKNFSDGCTVVLCIEAGTKGWESIEYKEIYKSAVEYIGEKRVVKLEVIGDKDYIRQLNEVIKSRSVTHYLYDPRTGSQRYLRGLFQSLQVALLLYRYRITPIVLLTDLSVRMWRCQAAMVSSMSGLVVSFMSSQKVQPIFPHKRLIGPSLMPFSNETLNYLVNFSNHNFQQTRDPCIRFTGSLYEPRTSFLNQLKDTLTRSGYEFEILGRAIGSTRVSDEEYWKRLSSALIIITTADQMHQSGTDWTWINHLVYRYLEVLAAGSLLLAPSVPGVNRYFIPGVHFVSFNSEADASIKARYYLDHPEEANKIARAGHKKATHLIRANVFWLQIDTALGYATISP
jgi:hypothetical protein